MSASRVRVFEKRALMLTAYGVTHPGKVRPSNEDSMHWDLQTGLFVVADGMGGHQAGEVASRLAIDAVRGFLESSRGDRDLTWPFGFNPSLSFNGNRLVTAVKLANRRVFDAGEEQPDYAGMGTTIVAAVFCGNRVSIGHIGDSRCYRLRGEKFEQLTRDHSLLQEQIDSGVLTQEQARFSLNKNLVTRALGIEAIVPTDIAEYRIEANDIYLLCSDGLTDMVDPDVIHSIIDEKRSDLAVAAGDLIDLANQNGGRDNISVVLVRIPPEFLPASGWAQRWLAKKKG